MYCNDLPTIERCGIFNCTSLFDYDNSRKIRTFDQGDGSKQILKPYQMKNMEYKYTIPLMD